MVLPNARLAFAARHDRDEAFEMAVRAVINGLSQEPSGST
jgi:hypothetical protein